jgi:hypothetical protein
MPTDTPQMRLHMPTVSPAQKSAKPVYVLEAECRWSAGTPSSLAENTMDMMTP